MNLLISKLLSTTSKETDNQASFSWLNFFIKEDKSYLSSINLFDNTNIFIFGLISGDFYESISKIVEICNTYCPESIYFAIICHLLEIGVTEKEISDYFVFSGNNLKESTILEYISNIRQYLDFDDIKEDLIRNDTKQLLDQYTNSKHPKDEIIIGIVKNTHPLVGAVHQCLRLIQECWSKKVFARLIDPSQIMGNSDNYIIGKIADAIIFLDKNFYLGKLISENNVMVNSIESIDVADDKFLTYLALKKENVEQIETILGTLKFYNNEEDIIYPKLDFPFIAKVCRGSLGEGVFMIENRESFDTFYKKMCCVPHIYQPFIEDSKGEDVRAIVIGNQVVAMMKRVNKNDFRSNISCGGIGEYFPIREPYKTLAINASKAVKLNFCAVDICLGNNPRVIEVNSNSHFKEMERVNKINIAGLLVQFIIEKIIKR